MVSVIGAEGSVESRREAVTQRPLCVGRSRVEEQLVVIRFVLDLEVVVVLLEVSAAILSELHFEDEAGTAVGQQVD